MIKYITPKSDKYYSEHSFKVFLAGTIDNGEAEDWQTNIYARMCIGEIGESNPYNEYKIPEKYITIFSPRRDDWKEDATIEDIEEQIRWEQEKLEEADLIIMCLQDDSKSPISLLELGLYGPSGKLICFCTPNFYRYSNVKLTCEKFLIPLIEDLNEYTIIEQIYKVYNEIYTENIVR